jgi:hypothetical protein
MLTEDELDIMVTDGIYRTRTAPNKAAEIQAWRDVQFYEEQLASIHTASSIPGRLARVGAVRAAIKAGYHNEARRLRDHYEREPDLSEAIRAIMRDLFEGKRGFKCT